jgi:hypothetical protein
MSNQNSDVKDVSNIFDHYRVSARAIWNTAFWPDPDFRNWDSIDQFHEIERLLFQELVLAKLARKMSNGSRTAAIISFCFYLADTAVFAYEFRVSVRSHVPVVSLAWQALTVLVHIAGVLIL